MHPLSSNSALRRHGAAYPEFRPGQLVTWKDVVESSRLSSRKFRSHGQLTLFPRGRARDRQRSLERRRRLAYSGPMPPQLACKYPPAQLAALEVIGDEVVARGYCDLSMGEIAARAGCSLRWAQMGLRAAEEDNGHVRIQQRRVSAFRNETNIITIVSPEWLAWLKHRRHQWLQRRKRVGEQKFVARTTVLDSSSCSVSVKSVEKESGGEKLASFVPP